MKPTSKTSRPNRLRLARQRKNISLVKASDDTRIRRSVLEALERGETKHLPKVYVEGLERTYAAYLGLTSRRVVRKSAESAPRDKKLMGQPIVTTSLLPRLLIGAAILFIGSYALLQVYRFFAPPTLTIFRPQKSELVTADPELRVEGKTNPGVDVFIDQDTVLIEPNGSFQTNVPLRSGINDIVVRATNALGRVATRHITVVHVTQDERH